MPAPLEQAIHAPRDSPRDALHLGVVGWRERVEAQISLTRPRVGAVEHERVEVNVEVRRVAKALHESDGAAVPADGTVGEDPAAQEGAKRARDEAGPRSLAYGRAGQEGLELLLATP